MNRIKVDEEIFDHVGKRISKAATAFSKKSIPPRNEKLYTGKIILALMR